jgi:prefoldin subunit 5
MSEQIANEQAQRLLSLMGYVTRLERSWEMLNEVVDQTRANAQGWSQSYHDLRDDHQQLAMEARAQQLEIDRLAADNRELRRTARELRQEVELLRDLSGPGQALMDLLEGWSTVGLADHFDAGAGSPGAYHRDAWLQLRDACIRVAEQYHEKEAA